MKKQEKKKQILKTKQTEKASQKPPKNLMTLDCPLVHQALGILCIKRGVRRIPVRNFQPPGEPELPLHRAGFVPL